MVEFSQTHGNKKCPFSGVTNCGRLWRRGAGTQSSRVCTLSRWVRTRGSPSVWEAAARCPGSDTLTAAAEWPGDTDSSSWGSAAAGRSALPCTPPSPPRPRCRWECGGPATAWSCRSGKTPARSWPCRCERGRAVLPSCTWSASGRPSWRCRCRRRRWRRSGRPSVSAEWWAPRPCCRGGWSGCCRTALAGTAFHASPPSPPPPQLPRSDSTPPARGQCQCLDTRSWRRQYARTRSEDRRRNTAALRDSA